MTEYIVVLRPDGTYMYVAGKEHLTPTADVNIEVSVTDEVVHGGRMYETDPTPMSSREEFERWHCEQQGCSVKWLRQVREGAWYAAPHTVNEAWQAWQAARGEL